jgi:hypothetical protein
MQNPRSGTVMKSTVEMRFCLPPVRKIPVEKAQKTDAAEGGLKNRARSICRLACIATT